VGNGFGYKNIKRKNTKKKGQRRSEFYQVVINYRQNRHEVIIKELKTNNTQTQSRKEYKLRLKLSGNSVTRCLELLFWALSICQVY
jgi:hypothetical protein